MQGRLRNETLTITVETSCACCGRSMVVEIDQDMNYTVDDEEADLTIFVPSVDLFKLEDDSIIDRF